MDGGATPIELYQCSECGLHFKGQEKAEKREAWRKEHQSCSLGITRYPVERLRNGNPLILGVN